MIEWKTTLALPPRSRPSRSTSQFVALARSTVAGVRRATSIAARQAQARCARAGTRRWGAGRHFDRRAQQPQAIELLGPDERLQRQRTVVGRGVDWSGIAAGTLEHPDGSRQRRAGAAVVATDARG